MTIVGLSSSPPDSSRRGPGQRHLTLTKSGQSGRLADKNRPADRLMGVVQGVSGAYWYVPSAAELEVAGARDADVTEDPHFNRQYSVMLWQLEQAFNGNPGVLYDAIVNGMHGMMSVAHEMMCLPIEGDADAAHGAPSFEWVASPGTRD